MAEVVQKAARATWSSKWAFILAAAASAVGLGNLWRFPYLAAKYGGGMFLLTYLVMVFSFGVALLLLETALGRKTGQSVVGAFKSFGKRYAFIGWFTALIPFIIVPYYCVIGGWVAKYFAAYFTDGPAALADGGGYFTAFVSGNYESFLWMLIFMFVTFLVVSFGVKSGIEKANLVMMPALIVMAIALSIYTLSQPGALEGAAYYLIPDFSKFSPELVIAAMGQTFFSLSLAMGIMVTYGSYVAKTESLTSSATRVCGFSFGISLLGGLMIVPAAFVALGSGDAVAANAGPNLMFVILPQLFMGFGDMATVVGAVFFALVIFAALTSSISLVETCTSIVQDATNWTRRRSLLLTCVVITACGMMVNLGYNGWSFIQPLGEGSTILDFADFLSNSVMMPLAALMTCIFVGWIIKPKTIEDEIASSSPFKIRKIWRVMIKYVTPVLVVVILIAYVASSLGFFSL